MVTLQGLSRLMLVGAGDGAALPAIGAAVEAGLRLLQLRDREASDADVQTRLASLRARYPALRLLVNGRARLAGEMGLGLHLPEALPLPADWPREAIWGRAVHSVEAASRAEQEGAHYVLLGTIFPTASKPGHPGAGLERVAQVSRAVALPVFAIGGMNASRVAQVMEAGAYGIAVQRAILEADDPGAATAQLEAALGQALGGDGA